jgi:hypothetical protein
MNVCVLRLSNAAATAVGERRGIGNTPGVCLDLYFVLVLRVFAFALDAVELQKNITRHN